MEIPVDSYSGHLKDYGTDGVMTQSNEVCEYLWNVHSLYAHATLNSLYRVVCCVTAPIDFVALQCPTGSTDSNGNAVNSYECYPDHTTLNLQTTFAVYVIAFFSFFG